MQTRECIRIFPQESHLLKSRMFTDILLLGYRLMHQMITMRLHGGKQ
jgi:hypothetical protein